MLDYHGSCHCGAVDFYFQAQVITEGLRCNCSICSKKGAVMSVFALAPSELTITAASGVLATYEFAKGVAKHHFCSSCGIYTFHQTASQPGYYRINLGCLDEVDTSVLAVRVFNGRDLPGASG